MFEGLFFLESVIAEVATVLLEKSVEKYRERIAHEIEKNFSLVGPEGPLLDACKYALLSGGKRARPVLSLVIADALGGKGDALFGGLAVEFFHTASLVVDDLPSMDDDDERRSVPSVHKKFGEATALLVSYALIAAGYRALVKNVEVLKEVFGWDPAAADQAGIAVLENTTYNTGLYGATGGQFLDLAPPNLSIECLKDVVHKKTSSLFEIAFVSGWLFGGGSPLAVEQVKQAAAHFGLAFQIADDLGDMAQDFKNKRVVNFGNCFGQEVAEKMFHVEQEGLRAMLEGLGLGSSDVYRVAKTLFPTFS